MARASKYEESRMVILHRILGAQRSHAIAPSVREFAVDLGVGVATVHSYLSKLAGEGLVEWQEGRHRSLKLTQQAIQLLSQPAVL